MRRVAISILSIISIIHISCSSKPAEQSLAAGVKHLAQTMAGQKVPLDELKNYLPVTINNSTAAKKIEIASDAGTELMEMKEISGKKFSGYVYFRDDPEHSIYRVEIRPDEQSLYFIKDIKPVLGTDWSSVAISKTSRVYYAFPNEKERRVMLALHLFDAPSLDYSYVHNIVIQEALPIE